MSYREFLEYVAYWELEPFGDEWRGIAQVCWMLYSANGGQQHRSMKVEDFMPRLVKQGGNDGDPAKALLAWAQDAQAKAKQ